MKYHGVMIALYLFFVVVNVLFAGIAAWSMQWWFFMHATAVAICIWGLTVHVPEYKKARES